MCYINSVHVSPNDTLVFDGQPIDLNHLPDSLLFQAARRGFDYATWPVIKPAASGKGWELVPMEWGFIPTYLRNRDAVEKFRNGYKDAAGKFHIGYTTLNVVGEEMLSKQMFQEAALHKRCLVLSSGFYEHRHVIEIGKRGQPLKTPVKYPYHITLRGQKYFLMAGIYNTWIDKETGETIDSFAIVTTSANELMQQVHNSKKRMPTILPEDLACEWIKPGLSEERIVQMATHQFAAPNMNAYPVAKDFLNATDPSAAFAYENLSELV